MMSETAGKEEGHIFGVSGIFLVEGKGKRDEQMRKQTGPETGAG